MQGYLFLQLPFKTAVKFLGSSKARGKNKNKDYKGKKKLSPFLDYIIAYVENLEEST